MLDECTFEMLFMYQKKKNDSIINTSIIFSTSGMHDSLTEIYGLVYIWRKLRRNPSLPRYEVAFLSVIHFLHHLLSSFFILLS